MQQLDDILANIADQERGKVLELLDPTTGMPVGIRITIVGPDSDTARRARLALADEIAEMADADGRITAEQREKARLNMLAALIKEWDIMEAGERLPCGTKHVLRLLKVPWAQDQIDAFAADRRHFRSA